jgi:uncharacterized DUF497 family protein
MSEVLGQHASAQWFPSNSAPALDRNMPDSDHSESEQRYIVMGSSDRYRLLVVCYSEIGEKTRIISARRATRAESKSYEEK